MNHLTKETSERLTKAWVLDDVETEYEYIRCCWSEQYDLVCKWETYFDVVFDDTIKAPSFSEAFKLLPTRIVINEEQSDRLILDEWEYCLQMYTNSSVCPYYFMYKNSGTWNCFSHYWEYSEIEEAIEFMLIYLLDNQLLWNKK